MLIGDMPLLVRQCVAEEQGVHLLLHPSSISSSSPALVMPLVSTDQIAIWPSLAILAEHSVDSLNHTPVPHHQSSIHLSDR